MRDRTAIAVLFIALAAAGGGFWALTAELPASEAPNANFTVDGDPDAGTLTVEHAGGETLESGSVRVLVYEDRPIVPDRTVHGTIWETDTGVVQPGDRVELEDRRFAPDQRLVVRWFGDDGQANLHETELRRLTDPAA